jgi:hypothetical protein
MSAGVHNITIEQGATFTLPIVWRDGEGDPIDLTGYQGARMQVRRTYKSPDTLLSLTSEDGDIVLGTTDGTITVTASAEATAAINAKCGVYDLELVDPYDVVIRLLKGEVVIDPEATRDDN